MSSEEISVSSLDSLKKDYLKDEKHTVLRHALRASAISDVVGSQDDPSGKDFHFSIDIDTMPVSNQKRSGRCWIFSASTIVREIIRKKANIGGQFEISQNYISYYDKLEKYNYAMEGIIGLALKGEAHDSRKVAFLLQWGVSDGGQWDMFVDIIKKYGIVPKSAFPETKQSDETRLSSSIANSALRQFSAEVFHAVEKGAKKDELEEIKSKWFKKIYALLTDAFGVPPTSFDWEYTDKDKKYHIERNLTPKSFFDKYIGKDIDEYVSLINAPTKDKKYYQTYNIELVGNVIGGKPVTHLNLPFDVLEGLIIRQLKAGDIVWFGSDVSNFGMRDDAFWETGAFDYKTPFGIDMSFDKADMLDFYHSAMNHAMVITGVDLKDDKPVKWKIENSWGNTGPNNGYYIMDEGFFRQFVYQAAIKKEFLDEKELKALETKPVLLPPWDPFGTLAD